MVNDSLRYALERGFEFLTSLRASPAPRENSSWPTTVGEAFLQRQHIRMRKCEVVFKKILQEQERERGDLKHSSRRRGYRMLQLPTLTPLQTGAMLMKATY